MVVGDGIRELADCRRDWWEHAKDRKETHFVLFNLQEVVGESRQSLQKPFHIAFSNFLNYSKSLKVLDTDCKDCTNPSSSSLCFLQNRFIINHEILPFFTSFLISALNYIRLMYLISVSVSSRS